MPSIDVLVVHLTGKGSYRWSNPPGCLLLFSRLAVGVGFSFQQSWIHFSDWLTQTVRTALVVICHHRIPVDQLSSISKVNGFLFVARRGSPDFILLYRH